MSQIDVNSLLAQMRALSAQAQGQIAPVSTATPGAEQADFAALLKRSLDGVEQTQQSASQLATAFDRGDSSTDLSQVMVALQKADLSFRTMTEVRNKLVDAYRDIMNMPV